MRRLMELGPRGVGAVVLALPPANVSLDTWIHLLGSSFILLFSAVIAVYLNP